MPTAAVRAPRSDAAIGVAVAVASIALAAVTGRWTLLLVPVVWTFVAWLSVLSLPQRFAALAAATVLVPRYPLRFGVSLDDVLPSAAAIAGVVLLARWGWPRLPRLVEAGFGAWIAGGVLSAALNGDGAGGMIRLAAPSVGRPVFWLVFAMTAAAVARRVGLRALLIPIAVVALIESVFAIGAYARCGEIHLGAVSHPDNEALWESRRPLGVEQGAGTNVGEQRIRCRATGTLGQSSNFLAAFLVVALPVATGAAIAAGTPRSRWLFAAASVLTFTALLLTFTRASLIAAAVALVVTLLLAAPRRALPALAAVGVVLVVLALAVPQFRTRLSDERSDRVALWYSGWLIFADHPVGGVGYGNYREVQTANPKYSDTKFGKPTSTAHNGFIAIAAEGGVVQVAAVLVVVGAVVVRGFRTAAGGRGTPNGALAAGALGGMAGFLAQNMTNTLLLVPAVATYFWVLAGALSPPPAEPPERP